METKHNPFLQLNQSDQDRLIALIRSKGDFLSFCEAQALPLRDALAWRCEPHIAQAMKYLQDAEHTLLITALNAARAFCIDELQKTITEFRTLYKAAQPEVLAHIQRIKNIPQPKDSLAPPPCIDVINDCFKPLIRAFTLLSKLTGIGPITAAQVLPSSPAPTPSNPTSTPQPNLPTPTIKFTNTKPQSAQTIAPAASLRASTGAPPLPRH